MNLKPEAKKAIMISSLCSLSYLAVYVARNLLGATSPQMLETGAFSTEAIGNMSSIYFVAYAVGQLINGFLGERVKASYMISFGLMFAGFSTFLFPLLSGHPGAVYFVYGITGFFLAMIYAPMTKVVAENTDPLYAPRCSLGYTFSSFFGSPLAGLLAAAFAWQMAFTSTSIILLVMGAACLAVFSLMEKKGIVRYGQYQRPKNAAGGVQLLLRHQIVKFTLIAAITGVVRTTVVFWLPTYISQYLGFSAKTSALLFTVATFFISMTAFVAVFIYERLHRNMDLTILLAFCSAAVCFLLVFLIKSPVPNIICLVLAILSSNCAASMMWTRYCPGLRDTGMVSSATGFLDFVSYMAASAASRLFADAVAAIGWGNLILIWLTLMILGICVALPRKQAAQPAK